jgi:hypothetical protein
MHLLLSPGDLLGLLAAALLAGLRETRAGRLTILVLPSVWYLSGLIGLNLPFTLDLPWLSVLSFVILGAMVALDPKLPEIGRYWLGSMARSTACSTVLVIALLVSAAVVSLRAAWTRIAVRVVGSWVAAIGMLMFGWLARGIG